LTASGLSPAECGNQRRGPAEREPIIEAREKLRVRAINQFENRGNWKGNDSRCEAANYSVLLDLSGDAAVSGILCVWMKPRVKLRGGGEAKVPSQSKSIRALAALLPRLPARSDFIQAFTGTLMHRITNGAQEVFGARA